MGVLNKPPGYAKRPARAALTSRTRGTYFFMSGYKRALLHAHELLLYLVDLLLLRLFRRIPAALRHLAVYVLLHT